MLEISTVYSLQLYHLILNKNCWMLDWLYIRMYITPSEMDRKCRYHKGYVMKLRTKIDTVTQWQMGHSEAIQFTLIPNPLSTPPPPPDYL